MNGAHNLASFQYCHVLYAAKYFFLAVQDHVRHYFEKLCVAVVVNLKERCDHPGEACSSKIVESGFVGDYV